MLAANFLLYLTARTREFQNLKLIMYISKLNGNVEYMHSYPFNIIKQFFCTCLGLEAFKTHALVRRTPDNNENVQTSQSLNSTPRGYVDRVETSIHSREGEQNDKETRLVEEDLDQLTYNDIYRLVSYGKTRLVYVWKPFFVEIMQSSCQLLTKNVP